MLLEAVRPHLNRASLAGWRLGSRRQVTVDPAVGTTTVRLSWRSDAGFSHVRHGDVDGLDLRSLPRGVEADVWEAPPDDVIVICGLASDDDVRALNGLLGGGAIDKGRRSDGVTIYWLRGAR